MPDLTTPSTFTAADDIHRLRALFDPEGSGRSSMPRSSVLEATDDLRRGTLTHA